MEDVACWTCDFGYGHGCQIWGFVIFTDAFFFPSFGVTIAIRTHLESFFVSFLQHVLQWCIFYAKLRNPVIVFIFLPVMMP